MLVLSRVVLDGFGAHNGNRPDPDANRARLRTFGLEADLLPAERAFILGTDPTYRQMTDATWRSEALLALRWAVGDRADLPVGGQVSLMQAVPDLPADATIRAQLDGDADGPVRLRPEPDVVRERERWFAVYWRMRLRSIGVERLNLARWVQDNPYLTVLTPADLPLIDGDLSLDASVMEVARDDESAQPGGWRLVLPDGVDAEPAEDDWPVRDGRVPVRVCEPWMLEAGENVLRVASERLQALRWLLGDTEPFGEHPTGHYEPGSPAAFDKAVLYRDERFSVRGGLPWCHAAWRGDTDRLRSLLDSGVPTMLADVDGDLALHCAALGGHREALALLLEADKPIGHHLEDGAGRTVVDLAAARGDLELIDTVVAAAPDWRRDTALLAAVRAGHAHAASHLIGLGAPIDGDLGAALDAAVDADSPELVRCLAEHGSTVDGPALYRAVGRGRFAAAAALVDLGADVDHADETGTAVLLLAADRGATDLCLRLLDAGADPAVRLQTFGPVHFAMLGGHTDTALALIDRGADVSGADQPLVSVALSGGSATLVRWCLDHGHVPPPDAVERAVSGNHAEILRALIAAGERVDVANASGITPLHLAADRGHADLVEILLAAGAPTDPVVPGQNRTALDLAELHGHDACVRLLSP
jgi:ankyrin repeat protein